MSVRKVEKPVHVLCKCILLVCRTVNAYDMRKSFAPLWSAADHQEAVVSMEVVVSGGTIVGKKIRSSVIHCVLLLKRMILSCREVQMAGC